MKIRLKWVNFGGSKTGLLTVGYTVYDDTGSEISARSTSGVFEYGSSGIYGAKISLPERREYTLIWDTGEATPRYAPDEDTSQLDFIQEETDRIRVIWNTLQNTGDAYSKLLQRIDKIKTFDNKKDFESIIKEIKNLSFPNLDDIKSSLKITVNPEIKIPEFKSQDYLILLNKIKDLVVSVGVSINKIPKDSSEKIDSLNNLVSKINDSINRIYEDVKSDKNGDVMESLDKISRDIEKIIVGNEKEIKSASGNILFEINNVKKKINDAKDYLNNSIVDNTKMDKIVKELVSVGRIEKMIDDASQSNKYKESLRIALGIKNG